MFGLFGFGQKNHEALNGHDFQSKYRSSHGAVLIDVRTSAEFKAGSIRGARNIDIMSPGFAQQVEHLDKSKEYFLFCRSGSRSAQACTLMANNGFKVYNLSNGVNDWPG